MKEKAKEKVENEVKNWAFLDELKDNVSGFNLKKELCENGEFFYIFKYENEAKKFSVNAYFHDETMEYKVSLTIGLINFCDVSFFSNNIEEFEKLLRENMEKLIINLADESNKNLSSIVEEKGILTWKYKDILPNETEGFSLFLTPKNPIQTINGSYIVFNYSDFKMNTDFTVYYNIFRDEFFGESRIKGTPTVTYDFDSKDLNELEEKLKSKMTNYLKEITCHYAEQ